MRGEIGGVEAAGETAHYFEGGVRGGGGGDGAGLLWEGWVRGHGVEIEGVGWVLR